MAAARAGVPAEEADLFPRDLRRAEEAFLTGSLMRVVPIVGVGDTGISPGGLAGRMRKAVFGP